MKPVAVRIYRVANGFIVEPEWNGGIATDDERYALESKTSVAEDLASLVYKVIELESNFKK